MDGSRASKRWSPTAVARSGSSRSRNSQASLRSAASGAFGGAGDGAAARITVAAMAGITVTSGGAWTSRAEQALHDEQDVGRPLGEPPHVPGKPVRAVADQDRDAVAGAGQALLLGALDAVEEVELAGFRLQPLAGGVVADRGEEAGIVRPEDRAHARP